MQTAARSLETGRRFVHRPRLSNDSLCPDRDHAAVQIGSPEPRRNRAAMRIRFDYHELLWAHVGELVEVRAIAVNPHMGVAPRRLRRNDNLSGERHDVRARSSSIHLSRRNLAEDSEHRRALDQLGRIDVVPDAQGASLVQRASKFLSATRCGHVHRGQRRHFRERDEHLSRVARSDVNGDDVRSQADEQCLDLPRACRHITK